MTVPNTFEKTINTDMIELIGFFSEFHAYLVANSVSEELMYKLDLTVEEMVTNVVKYGYTPAAEDNKVTIRAKILSGQTAELVIEDEGHEFDPVAFDEPDVSGTIAEREVGGMGIHLARSMADEMVYKRVDNKNILMVKVNL